MLVLDRTTGEAILIQGVGRIVLCSACDGRAKIGLELDPRYRIAREELQDFTPAPLIVAEQREAVAT